MHIYFYNIPAKFNFIKIWNGRKTFLFFQDKKNENNKMSSDMRSVPDLKCK